MSKLTSLAVAVSLCLVTGAALADGDSGDNSMNPYTGDSYAALQGGGHNLGERGTTVTIARKTEKEASGEKVAKHVRRPIDFGHHAPMPSADENVG